jgi:hypothetical protein
VQCPGAKNTSKGYSGAPNKGGPVEERLYKKTPQYSKFEFSLPRNEN